MKRLMDETQREKDKNDAKKRQEKQYFVKMIEDNQKNQEYIALQKEKMRLEDVAQQKAYIKMMDQ